MEFQSIYDFSQELDTSLLDRVVVAFFTGSGPEQQAAQTALTQFQEHSEAWTRVPEILQKSSYPQTKFIGLQILEKLISTRWKSLPDSQRQGVRNFLITITIEVASDERTARKEKVYLNKLNLAMVQVLKQEWPHNWPAFISELVESSRTSVPLCENNMALLRLLSEEIFDFSADQLTQAKAKELKLQLSNELSMVFQLCLEVLKEAGKVSLLRATLETLSRFLSWIPLGYIFETDLLQLFVDRFLESSEYRNLTLKCAAEIASLPRSDVSMYDAKLKMFFMSVMTTINKLIPPSTDIASAYANASDTGQEMVVALALFLANFFSKHLPIMEGDADREALLNAHFYLIKISQVDEREVFKICLEYWLILLAGLYDEVSRIPIGSDSGGLKLRRDVYQEVLTNLRLVAVGKMVKPEEVLIVENEEGEVVREHLQETDTIVLYKMMRELMLYLTHLDISDTESILTQKMGAQIDGSEWSWGNLNTLCWAIGSISGAMDEETEKRFLVLVIRELLGLVEQKRGKDNKAIIASNIMYIVGQYPRFLKAHWRFLKTVVNKLFEFMHETHEGVQDMACDTYMKITTTCARQFVVRQSDEKEPFIDEIMRTINRITVDLSPQQVHTFYEATGVAIAEAMNRAQQERLIAGLMEIPNNAWDALMIQASQNVSNPANPPPILHNPESVKLLSNVLKTNVSACTSIGGEAFTPQIARIFMDMLGLYKTISGMISEVIAKEGIFMAKTPKIRQLRALKKDILKLMQTYINSVVQIEVVYENFIPPLLDAVLGDYERNVASARDAEVLNLMSDVVRCLGSLITPQVTPILSAVLEPTLEMITQDLTEYPDHRLYFFRLLRMIILNCFPALLSIPPAGFKLVMDSIIWAMKHSARDIGDTGLHMCLEILDSFSSSSTEVAQAFYGQYFLTIVQEIFYVMTDSEHKSGFSLQALILSRMFKIVNESGMPVEVLDPAGSGGTTREFFQNYCVKLLSSAFPHVHSSYIQTLAAGMNTEYNDTSKFKAGLKDFLVQMKEFSAESS
ncbi:CRM1 C terminal-domain-containing protein [Lentinula aciculospora]|uniref:CRM1 C terminal-domain-containing protein n=1 Tax=Lentinula aciculospora TaxID=153920 RepID=A0A9W9DI34_9AGAR|nr:CRM1 C terminal-domain-containing protein [Lentinula aciculospora]